MKTKHLIVLASTLLVCALAGGIGIGLKQQSREHEERNTNIKQDVSDQNETSENQFPSSNMNQINRNASLKNVIVDHNKINIYVFWGDGCPHCEALFQFLETIPKEYQKYFRVYAFEVWYNEENGKIMDQFAHILGGEVGNRGVPYIIVGEDAFRGYDATLNQTLLNSITTNYHKRKEINQFLEIVGKN